MKLQVRIRQLPMLQPAKVFFCMIQGKAPRTISNLQISSMYVLDVATLPVKVSRIIGFLVRDLRSLICLYFWLLLGWEGTIPHVYHSSNHYDPDAPWDWNIYLHLPWIHGECSSKYSSPMEHMGDSMLWSLTCISTFGSTVHRQNDLP